MSAIAFVFYGLGLSLVLRYFALPKSVCSLLTMNSPALRGHFILTVDSDCDSFVGHN